MVSNKESEGKGQKHAQPTAQPALVPSSLAAVRADPDDETPFPPELTSAYASNKKELDAWARENYGPDYYETLQEMDRNYAPIIRDIEYPTGMHGQIFNDTPIMECLVRDLPATPMPAETPFAIVAIAGKGEGMIALREIALGEAIVVEYPIVSTPSLMLLDLETRATLHRAMFDRVGATERAELYNLANSKPAEMCTREEGIVRTNGIGIDLHVPPGMPKARNRASGVFLKTSKCNHSCAPNAVWKWDLRTFTLTLSAVKPIRAGEEITVAYIGTLTKSRAERRAELQKSYQFHCECPACNLPTDRDVAASDSRRLALENWHEKRPDFGVRLRMGLGERKHILVDYKVAIAMHEKEGLQREGGFAGLLEIVALMYALAADVQNFYFWMQRALMHYYAKREYAKVASCLRALKDPKALEGWGVDLTLAF
ncbi:hypothetical protein PLICRDRAFT_43257 [Plicaturopsis crispa FD-325 SS-3]|nr:hypothetical protein PLICRDRAFT_43257 [Plicaturopsis crispa FD-325 SS-3]